MVIEGVIDQHAESAVLWRARLAASAVAADVRLPQFARHCEQLAAHLDGLRVAGDAGIAALAPFRDPAIPGGLFPLAVLAIERDDARLLGQIAALAGSEPRHLDCLEAAWDWALPARPSTIAGYWGRRFAQLSAILCGGGAVPDGELRELLPGYLSSMRARGHGRRIALLAAQTAATDLLQALADTDPDPALAIDLDAAAVLLGRRDAPLRRLQDRLAAAPSDSPLAALTLLAALPLARAREAARVLGEAASRQGSEEARSRTQILAVGHVGDPVAVPWLIDRMREPALARVAGAAFVQITGADLADTGLEARTAPAEAGPTSADDPDGDAIATDPDEALAWPDVGSVERWWQQWRGRFQPGQRYLLGAPPTVERCQAVLRTGTQRQRHDAAIWRCILSPGTPLFATAAPISRQRPWLEALA